MQWLGHILKCPVCGLKYKLDQTRVIETEENEALGEAVILIHSDCSRCKSSVMFNIEIHGPEVFSVGMVTDLTHQDSAKFKDLKPLTPNDVIGIHRSLREFKGDLVKVLTQKA